MDFAKGEDKDEKARAHLAKFEKKQGAVLIGKVQEKALGYKGQRKDHGTKEGIDFEALHNGFLSCENPERLQVIYHQLDAEKIQALFDRWVEQIPWSLSPSSVRPVMPTN